MNHCLNNLRNRKGGGSGWAGRWRRTEGLGRLEGGEIITGIYYMKKVYFQWIKKEKEKKIFAVALIRIQSILSVPQHLHGLSLPMNTV